MKNYLRTEYFPDVFQKLKYHYKVRLEPRQRNDDFSRSIQAKIADPLWMIGRQYQLGEFKGDDGGSPIKTKLAYKSRKIAGYCMGPPENPVIVNNITENAPLEYQVEKWQAPLNYLDRIRIGVLTQNKIQTQIAAQWVNDYLNDIKKNPLYCITPVTDDELITIDESTARIISISEFKTLDAKKLVSEGVLSDSPNLPNSIYLSDATPQQLDTLNILLKEIYTQLIKDNYTLNPARHPGWNQESMEYQFAVSSPNSDDNTSETVLVSRSYMQGELDWHTFSSVRNKELRLIDSLPSDGNDEPIFSEKEIEVIPTNITFRGMPNQRWWEFEDQLVDFGDPTVNISEIGKLLTMQFSLVYSNDWFIQPIPLKIGTLTHIDGIIVKDVFGVETSINRAGTGNPVRAIESWDMFSISVEQDMDISNTSNEGMTFAEKFLFVPPVLGFKKESKPLEELHHIRDEQANMSWVIESTLENGLGNPVSGYEEYLARTQRKKTSLLRDRLETLKSLFSSLGIPPEELPSSMFIDVNTLTPEALASVVEEAETKLEMIRETVVEEETSDTVDEKIIKYQLATSVPGNWIPYIPVHVDNQYRQVQLRRAAMVSGADNDIIEIVNPSGQYLLMAGQNHRINEEVVSRAALKLQLTTQRARWVNGETLVWRSWKVNLGGGEGSSGLKFDYIDE